LAHILETMSELVKKLAAGLLGIALAGSLGLGLASQALAAEGSPSPSPTDAPAPISAPLPTPVQTVTPAPTPTAPVTASVRPAKVINLTVAENQPTQVTLAWEQPLAPNAQTISDYRVTYKFDDFGGWITWKHAATTDTRIAIPNLPLGLGISFSIRPVSANFVGQAVQVHLVTATPPAVSTASVAQRTEYNFVAANWKSRAVNAFGYYPATDCANWASQALLRRGFLQTAKWHGRTSRLHGASMAWISSTKLHDYLLATGKVTLLTDAQRSLVQVGDIVQFDWWNTGMQEHTGIVSAIIPSADGLKIYYASHTAQGMWWSVDRSIHVVYPGATVSYLHVN
jgi:Putative amidase domain/Fibronectin type III domain